MVMLEFLNDLELVVQYRDHFLRICGDILTVLLVLAVKQNL